MGKCVPSEYTVIVPRADATGPTNFAIALAKAATASGHRVRLLYLSGAVDRQDLGDLAEVRKWRWTDLFRLEGVIHSHGLRPDLLNAVIVRGPRRNRVTTLHNHFLADLGLLHPHWKVWLAWRAWSWALGRLDHRVCISQTMRRYYRRLLPTLEFDVAYNFTAPATAVDTSTDQATAELCEWVRQQRSLGRLCLAYIGAWIVRKNVVPLVKALSKLEGISLVLCGGGPLEGELRKLASDPTLAGRVRVGGFVGYPRHVVRECDVLILPSRAEGMPAVVLEAACEGRPSLMSRIAIHREMERAGVGLTFDGRRFKDLEQRSREAIGSHGRGGTASGRLTSVWAARFSPEAGFERYSKILWS